MTVAYGKGPKGRATRLHSLVVRARGRCESCGESDYSKLQCAHLVSRKFSATRTDEKAAFALCAACHRRYTDFPLEFAEFAKRTLGEAECDRLHAKAHQNARPWKESDWLAECERLAAIYRSIA